MILYLTHGNGEESIPLKLPASSSQVDEIYIRLDDICSGEGNFRISDVKSSVKGLWQFTTIHSAASSPAPWVTDSTARRVG